MGINLLVQIYQMSAHEGPNTNRALCRIRGLYFSDDIKVHQIQFVFMFRNCPLSTGLCQHKALRINQLQLRVIMNPVVIISLAVVIKS